MGQFDVGAMLHFIHVEAVQKVKTRPATVATPPTGGRYPLFYGSTFKRGSYPRDAIIADPTAPTHDAARDLADELGGAIDERTYFHGTMTSEIESSTRGLRHFADGRFPNDHLAELEVQAEDHLIAIHKAWHRLDWVLPHARMRALDTLWRELKLSLRDELALTMVLYDGYAPAVIAGADWYRLRLLPRTPSMAQNYRGQSAGSDRQVLFRSEDEATRVLEPLWNQLSVRMRRERVHLPPWRWPPGS
jgi:hypothetical protein